MAMMKTGNPVPSVPVEMMDGYTACMSNQPLPEGVSSLFREGYALAEKVKEGKASAPAWANGL
jgi:hypothetical protein